ncbi:hypothetical protein LTR66_003274 [Elasticomyces elasticus]|nr:hypothetical protein LTR50_000598 [Elasticomyces elasticus]KAK4997299.1 hypothetical protein LTR66_003274 [Elasticomyces elasticus]
MKLARITDAKGNIKIIGTNTWTERLEGGWNDYECIDRYQLAQQLGCDLLRICMPAASFNDNFASQAFRQRVDALPGPALPLICYNTGSLGRASLCYNSVMTPVSAPAVPASRVPNMQGLLTAAQATNALFSTFVLDPMRFYIFGENVSYSLSPEMHNAAYKACGLAHVYSSCSAKSIRGLNELVNDDQFGGAAITQPYKTEVIALTHSLSHHAKAIGAVNTLIPIRNTLPDGSIPDDLGILAERNTAGPVKALYGANSDWIGIRACIRKGLSPINTVRANTCGLVIGAGGMARAAVYAMMHLGVTKIFVCNRTLENAEKMAAHFNRPDVVDRSREQSIAVHESAEEPDPLPHTVKVIRSYQDEWPTGNRQPTIIVSCIPVQRTDNHQSTGFTLPPAWLKSPTGGVVVELAYKPLVTPLVLQMRAEAHRGWILMDGLDMLPEQAFAQFELFTGRRAPRRLMRAEVLRRYRNERGQWDHESLQPRLNSVGGHESSAG